LRCAGSVSGKLDLTTRNNQGYLNGWMHGMSPGQDNVVTISGGTQATSGGYLAVGHTSGGTAGMLVYLGFIELAIMAAKR
jgi:hypothetical protein